MLDTFSNDTVLFAYALDGKGGGRLMKSAEVAGEVLSERFTWLHLDAMHSLTASTLRQMAPELDELIVRALLAEETRPRFVEFGDGALIILRGVNLNPGAEPDDMVSTRLWVDTHGIISLQRRDLLAVTDMRGRLANGTGPRNPGDFVALLIRALLDRIEHVLDELEQEADVIEEKVFGKPDASLRLRIVSVRQQAITFRRYMSPQRDVTAAFALSELPWVSALNLRDLHESHDRLTRYVEELDAIRDRTQIVQDALSNQLTEQLSRNIFVLSVVSAVFMPLSFVAGLFGMNVGGIPGAGYGYAFAILSALSVLIISAMVLVFKKLKWF